MFSLRDTLLAVDEDGVTFRSVYDGVAERLTPERAMAIQTALGSDIAMAFDECPPGGAERSVVERAVERTATWAERSVAAPAAPGQLRFGIVQGGVDPELRERAARQITSLPFDGFALGGLSVGEDRELMFETTERSAGAAAVGATALLHGHRRPGGRAARDRGRDRHVRLRAADEDGANGIGTHLGGASEPA